MHLCIIFVLIKFSSCHRPLLLSSCIIPRDERSETICQAILDTLNDKARYLDEWTVVHENMFGQDHSIPQGSEIHLSKLEGGLITTDTCNAARLLGRLLVDVVDQAVEEKRQFLGTLNDDNTNTLQSAMILDCHNHMRNVLIKAAVIVLSVYLSKVLESHNNV